MRQQKAATGADAVTALYDLKHGNPQEKTAHRESNDEAAVLIRGYVTRLTNAQNRLAVNFPSWPRWTLCPQKTPAIAGFSAHPLSDDNHDITLSPVNKHDGVTGKMRMTKAAALQAKERRANQQRAGLALLKSGRATTSEVARLLKSSRQRVQNWVQTRGIDVTKVRARWLAKEWKTELEKPALAARQHGN
jgi:hypothetical protein